MKFRIFFLIILLFSCYRLISQENQCYHLKYIVETSIKSDFSHIAGYSTDFEEYYLTDNMLVYVFNSGRCIIDLDTKSLTLVDDENKTYIKSSIPFDPLSVLTEVSALRYLNTEKVKGTVIKSNESLEINEKICSRYNIEIRTGRPVKISQWISEDVSINSELFASLIFELKKMKYFNCTDMFLKEWCSIPGVPFRIEINTQSSISETNIAVNLEEISKIHLPESALKIDDDYINKNSITYNDLSDLRAGTPPKHYNKEELAVLEVIKKFRTGCLERDVSRIDRWIKELFAGDVFVLGTDAAWPDTWEWRGGLNPAKEMFTMDWKRWGDVEIFLDDLYLSVDKNAAWAVAFATVTREANDDDRSRRRSMARINEYIEKEDWSSRRILYEIIADAGNVLVQYERDDKFISLLRINLNLVKREGRWLLKLIHFSHPASGFRSRRLYDTDIH